MLRWALLLIQLVALAALWAFAVWLYPKLPEQFPIHFDGTGTPDRWTTTTPRSWFLLSFIGTAVQILLATIAFALPWMARNHPQIVNVPQKEKFIQLDANARQRAVEPSSLLLLIVGVLINALFAWIQWGTYQVAIGTTPTLGLVSLLVVLPLILIGVLWCHMRTRTAILLEWVATRAVG
ncbi:MAG: DUF1648 domain-containing protein [Planctomycetota bacterium]|nr:DUF1648 domain-containing protein [Planctomycetota bacterium]